MSTSKVVVEQIPAELKKRPRWVVWRYGDPRNGGKPPKVPFNVRTGKPADITNPVEWSDFEKARANVGKYDGLGFVLNGDGIVGIDLDNVLSPTPNDASSFNIEPWALGIVRSVSSYWELSPSGRGLRSFLFGQLPKAGIRRGTMEIYGNNRFLTVTGAHVQGTPPDVCDGAEEVSKLYNNLCSSDAERSDSPAAENIVGLITGVGTGDDAASNTLLTDDEVIRLLRQAENHEKFETLFDGGDWQALGYPSASEADFALCAMVAFYTRDQAQIDRIFQQSKLDREKWERADYREMTIQAALRLQDQQYFVNSVSFVSPSSKSDSWPRLDAAAYCCVVGDIVRTIEPHSEADPVAVLVQILVMFGNIIGRSAYFQVEKDKHHGNLFSGLVGETSKGRKGVSKGQAQAGFRQIDQAWCSARIQSGLSSGEGLIWAVRDDAGIEDKRLFVMEPEFASVLRVIGRDGNTLSAVIRSAWDDGNLRVLNKNSPAAATDAHISIVGHITRDELRRYLGSTETGNGFANRFLWVLVRRSKILPFGGNLDEESLKPLIERLREAVKFARSVGRVQFDAEAKELWRNIYPKLSEGEPGLLGAVTSRAEAQVVRLAMLYALLDCSIEIRLEHLKAALALWNYTEQSARYIFGDAVGDPVADEILSALRACPQGMTRTEISNLFQRNRKASEIGRALDVLARGGRIRSEQIKTGGRDSEVWKAA